MRTFFRRFKKLFVFARELVLLVLLYPISHYVGKNKEIYIFSERGLEARDNGLYMYRYFREHHPEKKAYYVIGKNSEDYKNVENYGNLIYHNSIKHHVIFYAAKYCISTHLFGYTPNIDFYARLIRKGKFSDKVLVSLAHGILKNNISHLYYERTRLNMLVTGAKPAYEYVKANFHYKDDEVKYTGLARFDGLHDFTVKNQILVMPTWRNYLYLLSRKEFVKSQYFKAWNDLLCDKETDRLLKEHNLKLIFYPHYELQKYVDLFESDCDNVVIADKEHYDVQTLLKESKFMITDFSSVLFDFAYMKKPCMYYQFDRDQFYGEHYQKGYFDEAECGFGELALDHESLMKHFREYVESDFQMKDIYLDRITDFFELHDDKNCERIYNEIQKLVNRVK